MSTAPPVGQGGASGWSGAGAGLPASGPPNPAHYTVGFENVSGPIGSVKFESAGLGFKARVEHPMGPVFTCSPTLLRRPAGT